MGASLQMISETQLDNRGQHQKGGCFLEGSLGNMKANQTNIVLAVLGVLIFFPIHAYLF